MSLHSSKPRSPRILAASLGVLAIVAAGCADSGGDDTRAPSPLDSIVPSAPARIPEFRESRSDVTELSAPPADPLEAVRQYVTAEIAGDGERSFGLLSASAQASAGSAADWVESTSQRPTILAFELDPVAPLAVGRDEVSVTGTVTLPAQAAMALPGDNLSLHVELEARTPVAMGVGLRFAIREGGKTVGSGVVAEVLH